jgi:tetratricopeptide (TPR) repeat protein
MGRASRAKRERRLNASGSQSARGGEPGVYLSSYTITYEPLEENIYKLPSEVDEQYPELHDLALRHPEQAISRLEPLLERFPDVPQLYNLLAAAYAGVGRREKSDELTELNYRKAPDYFFARIGYAGVLLERGQPDAAQDVLGGTWDLKQIFRGREVFHISEIKAYLALVARFNVAKDNLDAIPPIYEVMKKLAPGDALTDGLGRLTVAAKLREGLARLKLGSARRRAGNASKHLPPKRRPRDGAGGGSPN